MSLRLHLLAGPLCVLVLLLPSVASASEGTFTHVLCANPDTGKGVVSANGKLPDGTTNPYNEQAAGVSAALSRCTGTLDGGGGMPVTTGGGWSSGHANRGAALRYRTPAGIAFNGGSIWRHATMSGRFGWTVMRSGRWDHIFGTPADERCTWGNGCYSRGTPSAPWSDANRVRIGSGTTDVPGFDVSVLCDIPEGWSCHADGSQTVRVYGGKLVLEDSSGPLPGGPSGALASAASLSGDADVLFNAADTGSGLYRVRLLVDGVQRLSSAVHENGGRCVDANPANADDYEFAWQQPCRPSASVAASFDTRLLPEGSHAVKVLVEDAGGNDATVLSRTVTIDNVPPPSVLTAPTLDGLARRGSGLVVAAGSWDAHGATAPSLSHRWQRCRFDGSACADVAGADGATYVLATEDLGRRMRVVERASNDEGSGEAVSALTDVVTREDGTLPPDRDGVDNDGDGEVDEPGETGPNPTTNPPPSGSGGHTDNPSGVSGTRIPPASGASSGAASSSGDAVNGEGASSRARLTVAFAGRGTAAVRTLRFGRGTTAIGRLVDERGTPIRNAIVDVESTASLRGAAAASGQPAVTGADGTFTYRVDGRASSRTLRFAYRYLRAGEVVADASLVVRVRAAVRLSVKIRGVSVRYSGRVLSASTPRAGKLVVLQGRVRGGRWQTFASRRAQRTGVFRGAYRLKVRRPGVRLQFRARAVAESGWPYLEATSRTVTRRVK